jgi:hypothetical protein
MKLLVVVVSYRVTDLTIGCENCPVCSGVMYQYPKFRPEVHGTILIRTQ